MDEFIGPAQALTSALHKTYCLRLRRQYPFVYQRTLTHTAGGREITALQLGKGDRKILLTAAHHGNESLTGLVLWRFLGEYCAALRSESAICGEQALELYHNSMVYLVPLVNPEGADLVCGCIRPDSEEYRAASAMAQQHPEVPFPSGWKANLSGVDLNLNYPTRWEQACSIKRALGVCGPSPRDYPGRKPLDQPETKALAAFTACVRPDLMLALHAQGSVIYPGSAGAEPPGSAALAQEFSRLSGYAVEQVPPESANAGFKDWFLQRFYRPAFTIEVGMGHNPLPLSDLDGIYRRMLPVLVHALKS